MKRREFIQTMAVAVPAVPNLANNSQLAEAITSRNFQLTQPATRPSVQIIFEGLMLFTFEADNSRCVIGTMKCDNHKLQIKIDDHELIETPAKNVSIFSDGNKGIKQYRPSDGKIRHASPAGDINDLGWLMAIEGNQFHKGENLTKNISAIEQRISVSTGVFYTATRSSEVLLVSSNEATKDSTIATSIGCNIYLDPGEVLNIDLDGIITNRFIHENTFSKIRIKYSCDAPSSPELGDFIAYYQVYDKVIEANRYGVISTRKIQLDRGLSIQNDPHTTYCPPAEGEPPIG